VVVLVGAFSGGFCWGRASHHVQLTSAC
jgi:hypothetical protein